ncbi:MAG TPA: hypothetical protein VFJ17_13490 [Mycobacteriales bacterium]|jgi:hypothetical protein|nr:hypothetical protein [Mycobacteriales bacterium]
MRVRARNRSAETDVGITLDDDEAVVQFATSVSALSDVWSAMVWLQTTSPNLNSIRREIAAWARDTDAAIGEMFGRSVMSEEIRVLLDGMAALLPRRVDAEQGDLLAAFARSAQRLTEEGRSAIAHVIG